MKIKVPCKQIKMLDREKIIANNYNPNFVSADKMMLLKQSIIDNGFCFPIVTIYDPEIEKYVIIDGFHRFSLCSTKELNIKKVPVVVLEHDISKRMYATVQFNKARGVHRVDIDADLIRKLIQQGQTDEEISIHLGIDVDTIHRYKQLTGIADIFKNVDYSLSWEMKENE